MSRLSINSRKCKLCNAKYEIVYDVVVSYPLDKHGKPDEIRGSRRHKKMKCSDPECGFSIAFP